MAYITESQLRSYASNLRSNSTVFANSTPYASFAQTTIFLSHSSKDRELAQGLVYYLALFGTRVYVDWNDSNLPRVTNRETAEKLKGKIKENSLFMILATENALDSKWVPWEVGIADQCKGEGAMLLLPVADVYGQFNGSEYLQLYQRIEIADNDSIAVFSPGQSRGILLENHVRLFAKTR
jgi:hypothetical protein